MITARAGTPLAEIEAALARARTDAGLRAAAFRRRRDARRLVAAGLSGPRRPWAGAARDFVLGARMIDGQGKPLRFGGQVMKNVAGYDVSRLMAGSFGTLGRDHRSLAQGAAHAALPRPTLRLELPSEPRRIAQMNRVGRPAAADRRHRWHDGVPALRLSGGEGVGTLRHTPPRRRSAAIDAAFWDDLREQRLPFFAGARDRCGACRCRRPAPATAAARPSLIEWGGALRWLSAATPTRTIRAATAALGGHATLLPRRRCAMRRSSRCRRRLLALHRRTQDAASTRTASSIPAGCTPDSLMETHLADFIRDTPERPRGRSDPAQVRALRFLHRHLPDLPAARATNSTARAAAST